jgi:phosphatidylglycerol lysyltransferase
VPRQESVRELRPGIYRRLALTIGLSCVFLTLLMQRLQGVDAGLVWHSMGEVGLLPWLGAALATWASFQAIAGYDRALHCHLATGIAADRAGRAGFAAIAIGQMVGLGVISGGLVRWRMLPELGLAGALQLSLLVSMSFLLAWGVICAAVLTVFPVAALAGTGPLTLGGLTLLAAAALVRPVPWMPNLITQGRLLALAAMDCLAAGFALWLLMPGEIGFAAFLPVFLVALGAGLVSGAPAGLGAFEIILMALLPGLGQADVLAGVVAWRVVYYAVPAVIGAGVALLSQGERAGTQLTESIVLPEIAEAGLIAQGEMTCHPAGFVAGRTLHGLVALSSVADLSRFRGAAEVDARWPVLYKAGPRMAVQARAAGMVVLPLAQEAWLSPQSFRLDIPARAGLRRKLRKASAAGVVAATEEQPDWAELQVVNADWSATRGGERGFSMGRFDPGYLAGQEVVVARAADRVVGFASFHRASIDRRQVWTLDLMRPDPEAPDGTAQCLILAALEAARRAGVHRLSLAAVPVGCDPADRGLVARLGRWSASGPMPGLFQFKVGFAPRWQRLYIAGPSYPALALVGREIWNRVQNPPAHAKLKCGPRQHEEYEIATARNPWQREDDRLA